MECDLPVTQQEVMKTFMTTLKDTELSGRAAVDAAIKASSSFGSYQEVVNKFYDDWQNSDGNWHRFLVEKCGIVLDNEDTGAVSGADCGGASVKGADDILPSKGKAKYPSGTSFTVRGLTIYGIPPKESLTADQQYVVRGLYSWWVRDALKQIEESYGMSYTDADATNSRMKLVFVDEPDSDYLAAVAFNTVNGTGKEYESLFLRVNMAHFKNMSSSDRHGSTDLGFNLDRTLIHELVHGVMASNINYFNDLPNALIEGGTAELIHGIDDERYYAIPQFVQELDNYMKIFGMDYVAGNVDPNYAIYPGGYVFMRYFLKQSADTTFDYDTYREKIAIGNDGGFATNYFNEVTMTGGAGSDTITNSGKDVSIKAGAGVDVVKNYYADDVVINTGNGADTITNYGNRVSIVAGSGNDSIDHVAGTMTTIYGGNGNDFIENAAEENVIYGGAGKDTVSNSGAYTFVDGGAGNDQLKNDKVGATLVGGSGKDTLFTVADEAVIFGDAGNDSIIIGVDPSAISTVSSADILNDTAADSVSSSSTVIGGARSTVNGGEGDDIIKIFADEVTAFGDEGMDTVTISGANATVYGDAGADIFDNSGANNYIFGGADEDSVYNSGASATVRLGKGADSITNIGDNSAIYGDAGDDLLYNSGYYTSISGGSGNDTVINYGLTTHISVGAGADTIYNSGLQVSITGGAGNDSILNEGGILEIDCGSGDDYIENYGDHITITGGKGNDSIVNDGGKHLQYNFSSSSGQDTVIGANDSDTLYISTTSYSTLANGDDLTVKVGKGSITFQDLGSKNIIISNGSKNVLVSASGLFADDENNFSELDAIIENNFSVAEFENYPAEKISAKNIITYAK